jgi:hypothetical protein
MREWRSGSQILFGHLPEQTVDIAGGIWKVQRWTDARIETAIDPSALRDELIRAAYAWSESGQDGGLVSDLYSNKQVRVKSLNRDRGIWCEPFPRLYVCKRCSRLHDTPRGQCQCGSTAHRGQLPFVGYHDACGSIKTPYVRKCPKHGQRAVRLPGTAAATEIVFYCPVCNDTIHRGFGAACDCDQGGALSFTVHRSGSVFKPRTVVLINPPRRDILVQVESAGGGERALDWLLAGMSGRRLTDTPASANPESVRKMLQERGFDQSTIDAMIAAMQPQQQSAQPAVNLSAETMDAARFQAKQIALATFESRRTIDDLTQASRNDHQHDLYARQYAIAMRSAGIERIELVDRFPVLTGQFGYTRGDAAPGASRLRAYREKNGDYVVYGELTLTEALLVRLDPMTVHAWMAKRGHNLEKCSNAREAAISVLRSLDPPSTGAPTNSAAKDLTTLVHSYSHAFIKRAAVYAGIERSALSELLLPHAFAFFVYAAAKGDFVLGGLQALFETELHELILGLVEDEHRCALDPGCEENGSACAVCLHLGEPSCRMFNTQLSRTALAGGQGYFDVTAPTSPS